ncbi:hypothetical protein LQV63_03215 [Paenibacillus profundus]|uniref:Uncharacterized protein n=1 Tax=Paenibacillus profundus TaxID=1173085 RepID=A0ABS8YCU5_9BACL|nr:hypothetical protein [Paenibacillus profundus]
MPAVEKLDLCVMQFGIKGVTRTAIMREVVRQLLERVSETSYAELLLKQRLKATLQQYQQIASPKEVREVLSDYLKD